MPAFNPALIAVVALLQGAPSESDWIAQLQLSGWRYLHASEDQRGKVDRVLFTRPATKSGSFSRMWSRYEDRDGTQKSTVYLSEFDCAEGRSRILQSTFYAERNMTGRSDASNSPRPWSYQIPGTVGEAEYKRACATAPSAPE